MAETPAADEQSLYRKYRPRSFGELIGQDHVTQTLRNAVRTGSVGHAYLFTGMRGTGKTSTARILARAANCRAPRDGEPCNECPACTAILEHRCLDLIEIDAASHRDVQFARDLREKIGYAPSELARKVYIFDEVHMLTPESCNTLLKTLEEPPPNVIFLLATTDAHKMLPTIVSRCQRLELRPISVDRIADRLADVCASERLAADRDALELIATHATGSLRDALSLLDQIRAYEGSTIGLDHVERALGLARRDTLAHLTDCITAGDSGSALGQIDALALAGADLQHYARQLVQYWRDLLLISAGVRSLPGRPADARAVEQASRLPIGKAIAVIQALLQPDYSGRRGAPAQWQLELAVVQACELCAPPEDSARARVDVPAPETRRVSRSDSRSDPAEMIPAPETRRMSRSDSRSDPAEMIPANTREASTRPPAFPMPTPAAQTREPTNLPATDGLESTLVNGREPIGDSATDPTTAATTPNPARTPHQVWADVMRILNATPDNRRISALFNGSCTPVALDGRTFVLGFFPQYAIIRDRADKPASRTVVLEALRTVLGQAVELRYDTIKDVPAASDGSSAATDDFVARAARELRAIHVERGPR